MIQMYLLNISEDEIKLQFLDGDSDMGEEINKIIEESGITVKNVVFPVNAYIVQMNQFGTKNNESNGMSFECGNIVDYIGIVLEQEASNSVVIFDFKGIDSISETFSESYAKLLLNTSCKIITINMSVSVYRNFNSFIEGNFIEEQE